MKKTTLRKLISDGIYAIAKAYLESSVVVYLRRLYGITDYAMGAPNFEPAIAAIEVGRELSTLIMLLAMGWATGITIQSRLSYSLLGFGVWDIFYYFWLWVLIRWPSSIFETDLLFLIPLPWWGPVIAPVLVAILMIMGGISAIVLEDKGGNIRISVFDWAILITGVLILLYLFMEDAISIMPADVATIAQLNPTSFNWPIYILGLVITGYVVFHTTWHGR